MINPFLYISYKDSSTDLYFLATIRLLVYFSNKHWTVALYFQDLLVYWSIFLKMFSLLFYICNNDYSVSVYFQQ